MSIARFELDDVRLLESAVYRDPRGSFMEAWNERELAREGVNARFVQDNLSVSRRHTIRGLHYQISNAQGKLVRVLHGEIFDVIVDMRRSSPTFGRHVTLTLSASSGCALWVPVGFAHGFLALSDETIVYYKVTDYWTRASERTLRWNDPALGVAWPLGADAEVLLSDKDSAGSPLSSAETYP